MVALQALLATTMGQAGFWMSTTSMGSLLWSSVRSSFWLVCRQGLSQSCWLELSWRGRDGDDLGPGG